MTGVLPPGPSDGVIVQTVRLHRDPLALLRWARGRFGDVFAIRLLTALTMAIRRLWPVASEPERMVLRGTILVPRWSGLTAV
jgi:hypothetical protein